MKALQQGSAIGQSGEAVVKRFVGESRFGQLAYADLFEQVAIGGFKFAGALLDADFQTHVGKSQAFLVLPAFERGGHVE